MKQKLYIAGLVNLLVILTGVIFKISHFPGAGILLTIGITVFVSLYLPMALFSSCKTAGNRKLLYVISGITCFVVFTAMLFKIMHWPFAGMLLTVAVPFPYVVFLPVFLAESRQNRISIYSTVFVLFLLALSSVMNALLSLNVSKQRIEDSYHLSHDINKVKVSLLNFPSAENQSNLERAIDNVLEIIDEYQAVILKHDGLTEEAWNSSPESLYSPDSRTAVQMSLHQDSELSEGIKLRKALESLAGVAEETPRYENLAAAIRNLSDLPLDQDEDSSYYVYFAGDFMSWSLIYLDTLETNLRLLKAANIL